MTEKTHADPTGTMHQLDLGDGHWLDWTSAGNGDETRVGALIFHVSDKTETGVCVGAVDWAPTNWAREHPDLLTEYERNRAHWTLTGAADEHLTLSPSLLCSCGDHGFIRDGKWIRA